jgi:hypothetical protein
MIPAGYLDNSSYTHYSLLRLVEDQFLLPTLGRWDSNATRINSTYFYEGKQKKTKRGKREERRGRGREGIAGRGEEKEEQEEEKRSRKGRG